MPLKKKAATEELEDEEVTEAGLGDKTDPGMSVEKTSATELNDVEDLEDVAEEEPAQSQSLIHKLKAKFAPKKAAKSSGEGTEVDGKKPKKKINPVFIAIIALLGIFLFIDFEGEQPAEVAPKLKPRPKPNKKKKNQESTEAPKEGTEETPKDESVPVNGETESEGPGQTSSEPPSDTTSEAATDPLSDEPTSTEPSTESPSDTPVSDTPSETTSTETTDTPSESPTEQPTEASSETSGETPAEPTTDESVVSPTESSAADTVDGAITPPAEGDSMTDKILEDLEKQVNQSKPREEQRTYVAPPDYEYRGRGMVYNCAGKHWACVDGPSYKNCEDNYSSTKYLKKPIECYPFNVYENQKGCESMQNRLVSSNAKTDFCKGN